MNHVNLLSLDTDDIKPSKCQGSFSWLIFALKYLWFMMIKTASGKGKEKSNVGQNSDNDWNGGEVMNCFLVTWFSLLHSLKMELQFG